MYMNSPSGTANWTTSNATLGGWAMVLINSAGTGNPLTINITGGTQIAGAAFQPSTNQYMVVFFNGNRVEYYFLDI